MESEKERLITMFINIGKNEKEEKLRICKAQCERFLVDKDDNDIRDLINVIQALLIYFETGDKEESRRWVDDLCDRLYLKTNLSLYEIRIMNCLVFTETSIEKVIKAVEFSLRQLEIYRFHQDYIKVKIIMKLNLVILLTDCKFFDNQYKSEYDELISKSLKEVIKLNLKSRLNDSYYVATATIYKGILLKDQDLIYIGFLLLRSSDPEGEKDIENLIKVFINKYNISVS